MSLTKKTIALILVGLLIGLSTGCSLFSPPANEGNGNGNGNGDEGPVVLFEDNFQGDSLGDHWSVPSGVVVAVENDELEINAPAGWNYIDLAWDKFTGSYTIETKFKFSSDKDDSVVGGFGFYFDRPDEYVGFDVSNGSFLYLTRTERQLNFFQQSNYLSAYVISNALGMKNLYDDWHTLKIELESVDSVINMKIYVNDILLANYPGETIFTFSSYDEGGLSLVVYDSVISFDYIKVYR